jgi:Histidine kinase-, DNA gyrase B-, and HSP90-like ATPase
MTILGRTIEHLGSQMYKHRAPSIAELVANCWDAGATNAWINIPLEDEYEQDSSALTVMDDGEGMDPDSVQGSYMVVGRNRRADDNGLNRGRRVMGRKGIGKLAGFGLAEEISVTTWTKESSKAVQFSMSLRLLKSDPGTTKEIKFPWSEVDRDPSWPDSGTRIKLAELKHVSPIDIPALGETLARRFSRTTRGEMIIWVNDDELQEPSFTSMYTFPEGKDYEETELPGGQVIRYRYRFADKPLRSKELQGFVIYANNRTAQAPPFFFNAESTASSQHSTRYVTGEIAADYLDEGIDDESDFISTDRQELDWEKEELRELLSWGDALSRKVLRECAELRGQQLENWVLNDKEFEERLNLLDTTSKKEISRFLKTLGQKSADDDNRTRTLADSLIRAYEFRTFHDVIDDITKVGEDPDKLSEMLGRLYDWKVLESRAILEIVRGRLSIVKKLERMIINRSPETASSKNNDNLHDLLAEYPWLFNPEWQVFVEEKSIGKQLREWGNEDCPDEIKNMRVDFLAFARGEDELVVLELKRPGHAVSFEEIQRLEKYQVALMEARPNCRCVLVYSGNINVPKKKQNEIDNASDFELLEWNEMFSRAARFYSHYESILEGDVRMNGFRSKETEVVRTRKILETGSAHRSPEDRKRGLGSSDV